MDGTFFLLSSYNIITKKFLVISMRRRDFAKVLATSLGVLAFTQTSSGASRQPSKNKQDAVTNGTLTHEVMAKLIGGDGVTIHCYGDSVMWGATPFNLTKQSDYNAPKILGEVLSHFYSGKVTVVNNGISGTTLSQFISGEDGSGSSIDTKAALKPDAIYLNYGINDMIKNISLREYSDNLRKVVKKFNKNGVAVVFVTPNIMGLHFFGSIERSAKLKLYADEMRAIASQTMTQCIDQFEFTYLDSSMFGIKDVVPDGAHMSDYNYKQFGYNMAMAFLNLCYLEKGFESKLNSISIGSKSTMTVIENNGGYSILVSGDGIKQVYIPVISNNNLNVLASSKDRASEVYCSVNDIYLSKSRKGDIHLDIYNNKIRNGLKMVSVSSSADFILSSLVGTA
ncbi:SGNH/GDSL hydrolase family protein [Enterobacter vonholyi]|uniref:SGNH/GDSL hydrolase family protein n=1 Tax=Enterobacter vonholyi TaxID=2797505 RepID=UPI002DBCE39C|nr:SGNH/GDSL hydrolase family protein [Enterobacter vonholyi]MEB5978970.1 SGNH/GDSL hydrolase family protein [Enterobacter vonholyi]